MHTQQPMTEMSLDIPLSEFLGKVVVAALENETYEISSVFVYGGNVIDFEMKITNVSCPASLDSLQDHSM